MNTLSKVVKVQVISIHPKNTKVIPCPVYPSCIYYLPIIHSVAKLSDCLSLVLSCYVSTE